MNKINVEYEETFTQDFNKKESFQSGMNSKIKETTSKEKGRTIPIKISDGNSINSLSVRRGTATSPREIGSQNLRNRSNSLENNRGLIGDRNVKTLPPSAPRQPIGSPKPIRHPADKKPRQQQNLVRDDSKTNGKNKDTEQLNAECTKSESRQRARSLQELDRIWHDL